MTTIAFDKTHIAWDTLIIIGESEKMNCPYNKARADGNVIYAAAGDVNLETLITWYKKQTRPPKGTWELLIIRNNGFFHATDSSPTPGHVAAPFAMGSGAQYARGAMLAGATAKRACEIAAECDAMTGGEIKELLIESVLRKRKNLNPKRTAKAPRANNKARSRKCP